MRGHNVRPAVYPLSNSTHGAGNFHGMQYTGM